MWEYMGNWENIWVVNYLQLRAVEDFASDTSVMGLRENVLYETYIY